ncbi:dihydropteroate synthase [Pokkaliibacter sp. CJK22405]|uniref:dihydropteroate synthase n=1 Tax=Pokkaliibacter sp. CJK22405 TaxID=3384615 RepID=UPI0039848B8F
MKLRERELSSDCPQIMGILNVTPDSFSDGGRAYKSIDKALFLAEEMLANGASIIDVGGESTRPGAADVAEAEEYDRVVPVVEAIRSRLDVAISVDTSSAKVMAGAISAGAHLINDVRSLSRPGALAVVSESDVAVCLMHMKGEPRQMQNAPVYEDVVSEVLDCLTFAINDCVLHGIDKSRIILDPGFGFGKTLGHNSTLFRGLPRLGVEGCPLLVGVSRKTMVGDILGKPVDQRMAGSVGLAVLAVSMGAWIVRVHDVAETADAVKTAFHVLKG